MISKETVQNIAHLARLEFSDEELEKFTTQLNSILGFMEKLGELDTDKIEATSHAVETPSPMRDDVVHSSDVIKLILDKDAPDHEDNFFRVPKVI